MNFMASFFSLLYLSITLSSAQSLSVPKNIEGIKGSSVTLTCLLPKTSIAHPTISWEKQTEGKEENIAASVSGVAHINSELRHRVSLNKGSLTISSLEISDSGRYKCTVTAIQSQPQSAFTELIVTAKPLVSTSVNASPNIDSNGTYIAATCAAESGQPRPLIRWTNQAGETQNSRETISRNSDGTWNVRSQLILKPGLLEKSRNFSHHLAAEEKLESFMCRVGHQNLLEVEETTKKLAINVLYSPFAFISILGNRLTCYAEGNPFPSIKWLLPSGKVVSDTASIFLKPDISENGIYTCRAASPLKPDSVATLAVQKARDLPVLFRTILKLNTSLPTTASGYEITCSADVISTNSAHFLDFEWTRNGENLPTHIYKTSSEIRRIEGTHKSRLLSTTRFLDIKQGRDDAEFQCRLVNRSKIDGFVSSVERSVLISVDYAPSNVRIRGSPANFTVVEKKSLTLNCSANSQPPSSKEWYFNGRKIFTGNILRIKYMHRSEAGVYRCLAHNYVPGSRLAFAEARVSVLYPPSDLAIKKLQGGKLSCETRGGSIPPPLYSWIYPNRTVLRGNISMISLMDPPYQSKYVYTCLVTNSLGVALNATYEQPVLEVARIGSLSMAEFSATMVACVLVFLSLSAVAGYVVYRRRVVKAARADEAFKRYLNYAESPNNKSILSEKRSNHFNPHPNPDLSITRALNHDTSTTSDNDEKPAVPKHHMNSYKIASENPALECTPIAIPPQSCVRSIQDLNTPQSSSTKQFVDGSSVEITAVESLPSSTNPSTEQFSVTKSDETMIFDSKSSSTKLESRNNGPAECDPRLRSESIPWSVRIENIRKDAARQMLAQHISPMHYHSQGTLPRAYNIPRMPVNPPRRHPGSVIVSGYSPVLYDATWLPAAAPSTRVSYSAAETIKNTHCNSDVYGQNYALNSEKNLMNNPRPRSMSLSASSSSTKSYSHYPEEDKVENTPQDTPISRETEAQDYAISVPLSSLENGVNMKTIFSTHSATKKHQSLTLV